MIKYKHGDIEYNTFYDVRKAFPNVSFPENPTPEQLAVFGIEVIEVIPPEPTLDELKAMKKSEIADLRWQAQTANIELDGNTFHADEAATASIHAAVTAALSGNREWKTATGVTIKLNLTKLKNLFVAIEERKEALFVKEAGLSMQIDTALTPEEVSSVQWEVS